MKPTIKLRPNTRWAKLIAWTKKSIRSRIILIKMNPECPPSRRPFPNRREPEMAEMETVEVEDLEEVVKF